VQSAPVHGDAIPGDAVILRRPHFRVHGDELYFLVSRRPHARLAPDELAAWRALEEPSSLDELQRRLPVPAAPALASLVAMGVCEITQGRFAPHRRKVLVIEPHSDDAALSVGGTMWLRRNSCEFEVVTIASRSNFTSYFDLDREFFDPEEVSGLRIAEAALMVRLIGGRHRALGLPEATLRYRDAAWTLEWYRRHRFSVAAFIGHRSGEVELRAWTEAVGSALRETDAEEVWMPLGIGLHTDHELARNACLAALLEDPALAARRTVRLYEEVPYAARRPEFTSTVLNGLTKLGARLVPEPVPIEAVFAEKMRLITLFGSQFKLQALQADIESSARLAGEGGPRSERFWKMERPPASLDPLSLYVDEAIVRGSAARLARWARRHRNANRIRLLLVVPAGRWAEDMRELLRLFPRTTFEVHASDASLAEIESLRDTRIEVRVVRGRLAWARLALDLASSRPAPTVFLSGTRREREARWLSRLWPLADPIVLPTMDHLMHSLRLVPPT
jgi:LmbE family N-acetylglucosaminyl deacetylase